MEIKMSREQFPVRIALGQMDVDAGHPWKNAQKAIDFIDQSRSRGAKIIVLPEMIKGYMVGDMLEDEGYLAECMATSQEIKKNSEGVHAIWGDVVADFRWGDPKSEKNRGNPLARANDGRVLRYNTAYVVSDAQPTPTVRPRPEYNGLAVFPLPEITI